MKKLGVGFSVAFSLLITSGMLFAHHSDAVYDMAHLTTVKGVVTQVELINPHQLIHMKVTDANGKVTPWILVGETLSGVRAEGWTLNTLKPGDQITASGFGFRDGKPNMTWMRIVTADGKALTIGRAKQEKLGRYLGVYGKEQLSPGDYEVLMKSLDDTSRGKISKSPAE
jgi:hypothetical protein